MRLIGVLLLSLLSQLQFPAQAQDPDSSRPIKLVVPLPAGLSPDVVARFIGEKMTAIHKQAVVVENRAGAAGIIAAESVAKSPADGSTVFLAINSVFTINPHIYPKLPYSHSDFVPVAQLALVPYFLVVPESSPFKTVGELIAQARQRPKALNYASAGQGSGSHAVMEMFASRAGISMTQIPFKTNGIAEVMAGQVHATFEPATTAIPLIQGGKLRALAVTSSKRSSVLPAVPTVAETVSPGFDADGWQGLFVRKGTPEVLVQRLNATVCQVMRMPETREKLVGLGLEPMCNTPAEFQAALSADVERWGQVVKQANIRLE